MTTYIPTARGGYTGHANIGAEGNAVWLGVRSDNSIIDRSASAGVDRHAFLAAIETELDGIWIDRADLPEVKVHNGGGLLEVADTTWSATAARSIGTGFRRDALRDLAMAEYIEKHPPIDEAQVDALAEIIRATDSGPLGPEAVARRLVKAGVTVKGADR